jgi:hypothetical protein
MLPIKISLKCITRRLINYRYFTFTNNFTMNRRQNLFPGAICTTRQFAVTSLDGNTTVCWATHSIGPGSTACSADTVMTELFRLNKVLAKQRYMKLYTSVNTVTLYCLTRIGKVTFVLILGPVNLHTIQLLNKYLYRSVSYTITE